MKRAVGARMSAGNGLVRNGIAHATVQAQESFSPEENLNRARMQILTAMPEIIAAIIEKAQEGSTTSMQSF
jgi:hypothetical protein